MRLKQLSTIHFLSCSFVVLTASAAVIREPLERRLEDCTAATAGIGAEFESPEFALQSSQCSEEDTNAAKLKVIAGRAGTNWELTADSIGKSGNLQAEYIIAGDKVKVGSTEDATNGAKVAADLVQNLIDWKPWASDDTRNVDIADNKCNPWRITTRANTDPKEVTFQPQITTPMPLEALYRLMKEQVEDPDRKNILDGTNFRFPRSLKLVTQQHFQSNPAGIDKTKVTDDVLAFCTLVLSYGKGALSLLRPGQSPKFFTTFMPRTNFNAIFAQVSSKLPAKGDDLWALFNNLACYKDDGNQIDTDLCTGDPASPTPIGNTFGDLTFNQGDARCNIRDWIHGLDQDSQDDDDLTKFDKAIDGSIGKLKTRKEKMFNSQRAVPIFEFRDLDTIQTKDMEIFMSKVDQAIQDLHNSFANPPGKKGRRQDSVCTPTPVPVPTETPVPTQAPLPTQAPAPTEQVGCYDPGSGSANPPSCYISRDAMIAHANTFCGEVDGLATAKLVKGYAQDTYNGAIMQIDSDKKISKDECVKRFGRFIDGCAPAKNNPMNWKYGGELRFDGTHYKINVDGGRSCQRKVNADQSPMQSVVAKCDSFYQVIRDEFWIYGAGFLEDNFGKPLYDQMSHCIGSGVTDWTFEYYDKPDADGMEWKAFGHTPIWQKNCFSPVIKGSGGPDIPCNGSG